MPRRERERRRGLGGCIAPLLLLGCATPPALPPELAAPRLLLSIEIEAAQVDPALSPLLDSFIGREVQTETLAQIGATVQAYYEWLEWREVAVQPATDTDAQGRLRVAVTALPPADSEPAPEAWIDIPVPTGPPRASAVPAPGAPGGARPEDAADPALQAWLASPARVLIDASERRLYLRREDGPVSYPVAIGTRRTPTPAGEYWVEAITHQPTWYPPPSIRREHAAKGKPLPLAVPPGKGNPLGSYFVRLQNSIGIHGTNQPRSIGTAASHGCVRMHDRDVRELVRALRPGDRIIVAAVRAVTASAAGSSALAAPSP